MRHVRSCKADVVRCNRTIRSLRNSAMTAAAQCNSTIYTFSFALPASERALPRVLLPAIALRTYDCSRCSDHEDQLHVEALILAACTTIQLSCTTEVRVENTAMTVRPWPSPATGWDCSVCFKRVSEGTTHYQLKQATEKEFTFVIFCIKCVERTCAGIITRFMRIAAAKSIVLKERSSPEQLFHSVYGQKRRQLLNVEKTADAMSGTQSK
jgi:hypothetical protein